MNTIDLQKQGAHATIILQRGKVNAVNLELIDELSEALTEVQADGEVDYLVMTGAGKFFSFGFDVPELLACDREKLSKTLKAFCDLYKSYYLFDKPMVAALNGHTMAAGCVLALTADYRIMVDSGAKIALNEVTIGSNIFAGAVSMLVNCIGQRGAERMLLAGGMYSSAGALRLGLVDEIVSPEDLLDRAVVVGAGLASSPGGAFAAHKRTLRNTIAESWKGKEEETTQEMIELWNSPESREFLEKVHIRR